MPAIIRMMMASILACAGAVQAQTNVGELLDRGGRKLSRTELVPLLSGVSMSGDSFNLKGGSIHFDYSADGTVSGYSRNAAGREFRSTGTWSVSDSGRFCRDMTRENGQRWGDCRYFFRLADGYFAAETDDRSAAVEKRSFEKK